MKTTDTPVKVSRQFQQPMTKVWQAITLHEEMLQWFFENIPEFKAEKGFSTAFSVVSENRTFTHLWKVVDVKPEKLISYTWSYEEYPGNSLLTMKLTPSQGGTQLTLTHETTADFPDGIPEFERESCLGGWRYFINERLSAYLT